MADIEITCSNCSKTYSVSEFASGTYFKCPACETNNEKPQSATETEKKKPLTLQKREERTPVVTEEDYMKARDDNAWNVREQITDDIVQNKKRSIYNAGSWILFLVIGLATGVMRYGHMLSPEHLSATQKTSEIIQIYGPYLILAFHIIILLKAFKDSVFQGILCLLVPFYSIYYIFMVSDDFYMRAVLGGLLIGLGQDTGIHINQIAQSTINTVNSFIQTGGGSVR